MELIASAARRGPDDLRELLGRDSTQVQVKDEEGQTPLHLLASLPDISAECLTVLLKLGADVRAVDRHGWTALHCAARHGSLSACEVLLASGGALAEAKNAEGTTPLHYLARRSEDEEQLTRVAERMLPALNAVNLALETPLHLAASHDGCVGLLLRMGADCNAANKKHETPLHYAARAGRVAACMALLEAGARLEASDAGTTPLQVADKSMPELIQLLASASQRPLNASLRHSGSVVKTRPGQRRVEQLLGVHVRSLPVCARYTARFVPFVFFFYDVIRRATLTVHLSADGPAAVVFASEQNSFNPEWELDGALLAGPDAVLSARRSELWLCVWSRHDDKDGDATLLLKRRVQLGELVLLGSELAGAPEPFPPCSLVLELADGFFVDEATSRALLVGSGGVAAQQQQQQAASSRQMVADSYSLPEFVALLQSAHACRESVAEHDELRAALGQALAARPQQAAVAASTAPREARLAALRQRAAELAAAADQERAAAAAAREAAEKLCADVLRGRLWIGSCQAALEETARSRLPELVEQRRGTGEVREGEKRDDLLTVKTRERELYWRRCLRSCDRFFRWSNKAARGPSPDCGCPTRSLLAATRNKSPQRSGKKERETACFVGRVLDARGFFAPGTCAM